MSSDTFACFSPDGLITNNSNNCLASMIDMDWEEGFKMLWSSGAPWLVIQSVGISTHSKRKYIAIPTEEAILEWTVSCPTQSNLLLS
jgi:hypothetical protein